LVSRARRSTAVVGAALALALLCSSASLAASKTTQPGKTVLVYFILNDQKTAYTIYRTAQGGGTNDLFLEKWIVRGDFATFIVVNRGTKPHGFAFLGKKFPALSPGHKARFSRSMITRGAFPYRSTTDKGKAFQGVFPVY
jgi:hypothetical protein